jgi:hypothetical protein
MAVLRDVRPDEGPLLDDLVVQRPWRALRSCPRQEFNWNNGFNFIVGARSPNGIFFELKATAYGISKVRMMAGFEF